MLAPKPIELPADPAAGKDLLADDTALAHPDSPAVWAARAERELDGGDALIAYAYARTGPQPFQPFARRRSRERW